MKIEDKTMKVGFTITARMKSTRLPKKLTLKIFDREIIALMIDRLKQSEVVDEIIIATSLNPQDEILCEIAARENVKCFKGSEDDVLERLYLAAKEYELDYMLNITGDCPLVAFDFIEKIVQLYKETNADLITSFNLPHGFFVYGLKVEAVKKVLELKKGTDTEVWGTYFIDSGLFEVQALDVPETFHRKNYRLTLDYPEDFEFFKAVYKGLGEETYKKSSREIIDFLDNHPEIVEINEHCEEKYKKRWESQRKLDLK